MDHDQDDPLLQQHKQQLSTPLLDEPARIKCIKFPLVYLVSLPLATLLQALSPSDLDNEVNQLLIAPTPAYPDILEVRHVQGSQGKNEEERHHHPSVASPPGLAHIQEQDRLMHVNGQPVNSIEQLQRRLSQSEEKGEMVTVRLLRKLNPYAEYVDMDDLSSSTSSSTSTSSGDSSSYYYSSSQDDADQETSLLTMLMTGGGCLSFSPSSSPSLSSSSSSLTSTSARSSSSSSSSNNSSRLSTAQDMPLQPYESWGDETSLEHSFYEPLWCFPLFLYLIQAGDTLPSLARSFGLKIDVLRSDNRDKFKVGEPAGVLIPGQKLRVRNVEYDGKATAAMVARGGGGGRGREGGVGGGVVVRVPSPEKEEKEEGGVRCWREGQKQQQQQQQQQRRRQHVVVGGETMKALCARYGVSELDIRRSNRTYFPVGERSLSLREGMRLVIFPSAAPVAAAAAAAPGAVGSYMSPSAVGALWKGKGGVSSPSSSSPRTSSSGSNSSSSSSSSGGSGGGKGGGRGGGGDARPVLFPVVGVGGVV